MSDEVVYEVALEEAGLRVRRLAVGENPQEVTDPLLRRKALRFSLEVPTSPQGVRHLRSGQVAVLESLWHAKRHSKQEAEDLRWRRAVERALQEEQERERGVVVPLFPSRGKPSS